MRLLSTLYWLVLILLLCTAEATLDCLQLTDINVGRLDDFDLCYTNETHKCCGFKRACNETCKNNSCGLECRWCKNGDSVCGNKCYHSATHYCSNDSWTVCKHGQETCFYKCYNPLTRVCLRGHVCKTGCALHTTGRKLMVVDYELYPRTHECCDPQHQTCRYMHMEHECRPTPTGGCSRWSSKYRYHYELLTYYVHGQRIEQRIAPPRCDFNITVNRNMERIHELHAPTECNMIIVDDNGKPIKTIRLADGKSVTWHDQWEYTKHMLQSLYEWIFFSFA